MAKSRNSKEPSKKPTGSFAYVSEKRVELHDGYRIKNGKIKLPKDVINKFCMLFGSMNRTRYELQTNASMGSINAKFVWADLEKYNKWKDAVLEA